MPDYRPRLIFDIFLVNLPFPSLSEFLRLDELCPRTRNNYQSPFLPLPVKNRRKEARRGKKGETIVGERKETKRLTFTLPSRTKFPLHLPPIPTDFLATSPSSRYSRSVIVTTVANGSSFPITIQPSLAFVPSFHGVAHH